MQKKTQINASKPRNLVQNNNYVRTRTRGAGGQGRASAEAGRGPGEAWVETGRRLGMDGRTRTGGRMGKRRAGGI